MQVYLRLWPGKALFWRKSGSEAVSIRHVFCILPFQVTGMWKPHLCFNVLASGKELGLMDERQYALCCNVIPMGWLNSVGIMQEISENLVKQGGLPVESMVSRNRLLPPWMNTILDEANKQGRAWYLVPCLFGQLCSRRACVSG